jgi:hypothetical protein
MQRESKNRVAHALSVRRRHRHCVGSEKCDGSPSLMVRCMLNVDKYARTTTCNSVRGNDSTSDIRRYDIARD